MALIFGRNEKRQAFPYPPIPPYPGATGFGYNDDYYGAGSEESALRVPTVWACVSLLANTVSMLTPEVYQEAPDEPDGVAKKLKSPNIIRQPDPQRTQSEWIHCVMVSVLLRGNAFGIKIRDKRGNDDGIILVHPDFVQVELDDKGRKQFKVSTKLGSVVYSTDEMWHLPGFTLPGMYEGLSPIAYARATIGLDSQSRQFASQYFQGNAMPKAVVTHEKQFSQQQAQVIKDKVLSAMQGRDPLILGGNLQFTPLHIKPEESQFLETQNANVNQIARYFGINPEMVGGTSGSSMTYKNVEQRNIDFLTFSVQFWLKRIEDSLGELIPDVQIVKFAVDPLLRTDIMTQATVDNMRIAGKYVTPDETRAKYNLPPLTEEQKKILELVPIVVSPLGGMKGVPPEQEEKPKEEEQPDEEE